ncbi:hypothetical protein OZX74_01635 [Bifidobacterium sp. ESL0798]|uniref:hypothetical protein n=1 Tax=Bifidobacterium sp. ESL0798 TaxID=2983235 RepID=UPI0023F822E6|nr:hypothetical protein [Bifidobacterium sp. ESL0798]WEV74286.1 hypothetical protein OZX74_01635 [Bifidobacterium sp. ESL0798]
MKRLIHFPINEVLPIGGPAGYLSNLKRGLDEIGAHEYEFLPAEGVHFKKNKTLRRVVPKRLKDLRRLYKCINLPQVSKPAPVDYTQYRSIHFHSTLDLYTYRNALEAYKGNVILTSHSPCAAHKELLDSLDLHDVQRHAQELKRLAIIDEYAFKRADTIIFPCAEAEEPYFHTWNEYAQIRDSSKIRYLPTGICSPVIRESRSVIRKRYGIPDEAFLMCYIGRHNSIKGYDALVQATVPLLKKNNNYWMLVAGKEGPLYRPNQQHWVEAGWTNDPYSIIAAADVFILPNRETYFDLI